MINELIGTSASSAQTIEQINAVSQTDVSVLIHGESGVGKELVATLIHKKSRRAAKPMITVNCASIARDLFESEFFGHVKGAFTGAMQDRIGRFELADKGTLFLDEVGEIPLDLQGKLLRSLQQQSFESVGSNSTKKVDIRVIAATNRNLEEEVETGRFREDLYYRLSVFPIGVAPLRKRKNDIPILARTFFEFYCEQHNKTFKPVTEEQLELLRDYHWPGNIRELKSVMERAVILSSHSFRLDSALPAEALKRTNASANRSLDKIPQKFLTEEEFKALERKNLIAALEHANWKLSGANGAATLLGIKTTTLSSRMKALNINKPRTDSLYSRIGGYPMIRHFVDELIPRLRLHANLGRFWKYRGIDSIRKEKEHLIDYLCEVTGGPYTYKGRRLQQVHEGLEISRSDWLEFIEVIGEAASKVDLERGLLEEILSLFENIKVNVIEI